MLKVALDEAGKPLAEEREDKLHLTIEAENLDELLEEGSRKFAYAQRGKFGFGNGGLESLSGCYPVTLTDGTQVYRREVVLTRPI